MTYRIFFLFLFMLALGAHSYTVYQYLSDSAFSLSIVINDAKSILTTPLGQLLGASIFISGLALTAFIIYETMVRHSWTHFWVFLLILFFGVAVALPFYLYLRLPKRGK